MLAAPPANGRRQRRVQDTSELTDEEYLEQKMRLEKFQQTLKRMACEAGNKRCADCREQNPRYIDVTWGVYLCLLCSGAHTKTLGSTVVTVDTTEVDEQWIETLNQRGNDKVNDDLEYKLETRDKRKMSWSITNRAKFATRKYVNGEWMKPEAKIDLKNPAKVVVPEEDEYEETTTRKKKTKRKKKKKKKKKVVEEEEEEEEEPPVVKAPMQEAAKASAAPEAKASTGLENIFGGLSTGGTNSQEAQKSAEEKDIFKKDAITNLLNLYDNTPQQQPAAVD